MSARDLQDEVDAFVAEAPVVPSGRALEDHFADLVAYQRALHEAGLAVLSWPSGLGGRGLSVTDAAVVARRLGAAQMPEMINFVGIEVLAPAMMAFGDHDRLAEWLPAMASADEIWCQMFSEPDAGSDLANLATRAVAVDGGWLITGQKVWSTWAQFATWGLILARTGAPDSRHRGITAFVVRMDTPGIETRALITMTGEAEFAEVFLDEVFVGPEGLIGEVDKGWRVAMHILGSERGPYAVRRATVLHGQLVHILELAQKQELDRRVRDSLVDAVIAMRLLDLRITEVAAALDRGEVPGAEAAITKVLLTRAEQTIATAGVELLGAGALAAEGHQHALVESFLYSRAASIYGGSAQIQRNIIGERILGLPREEAS